MAPRNGRDLWARLRAGSNAGRSAPPSNGLHKGSEQEPPSPAADAPPDLEAGGAASPPAKRSALASLSFTMRQKANEMARRWRDSAGSDMAQGVGSEGGSSKRQPHKHEKDKLVDANMRVGSSGVYSNGGMRLYGLQPHSSEKLMLSEFLAEVNRQQAEWEATFAPL
eukprot:CAMPEP_0182867020 /NCGR_PEP_ID=MMETSP0034_2-20130328/8498_1 /TAXON_ID=156128 /ORGANISM="Nephroselmis pyriformis, Strain CCMP717" /LENGTH=166 /DNA_ID=CAMNT_0024999353 /DNA_START=159 /DNA_END=656 /DNA_ORIENTATION=+